MKGSPFAIALFALLAGCTPVNNAPAPSSIDHLDEAMFRCAVEPILLKECAYNGCHGQARSPFRLYSMGKLRMGAMDTLSERTEPITDQERHLNYLGAQAFSYGGISVDENLLLRKPMPASAGGYEHEGGEIFSGPDDPRAKTIRSWLEGGTQCPAKP